MGVVYKIVNSVNAKVYVGKTTIGRGICWTQHKTNARRNRGSCYLYKAMRKYGIENFYMEVLEEGISDDALDEREIAWIEKLNTTNPNFGYNCTSRGEGAKHGPSSRARQKGWRVQSPETRERIAAGHRGKKLSPEHAAKSRVVNIGRKQPVEEIARRANSNRKTWQDPERKARQAELARQRNAQREKQFYEYRSPEQDVATGLKSKLWWSSPAGLEEKKRMAERRKKINFSEVMKKCWETRRARQSELTGKAA